MKLRQQPFYSRLAYVLISIVIVIYGMYILKDLLIPLTFSGLFALLLLPVCHFLERFGTPRWLAITVAIILSMAFFGLFCYMIYVQIMDLEEVLPQLTEKGEKWYRNLQFLIRDTFHISRTKQRIEGQKYLTELLKNNSYLITNTLSTTTGLLGNLTLIPLYVFLLLLYRDFIRVFFYKALKPVSNHRVDVVMKKVKDVVVNYVVGLIIVIGIITWVLEGGDIFVLLLNLHTVELYSFCLAT